MASLAVVGTEAATAVVVVATVAVVLVLVAPEATVVVLLLFLKSLLHLIPSQTLRQVAENEDL